LIQTPGGSSLAGVIFGVVEPKLQVASDGKTGDKTVVGYPEPLPERTRAARFEVYRR
jgi:hypothetical protein